MLWRRKRSLRFGREWNEDCRSRLATIFREMGAKLVRTRSHVGGSQELTWQRYSLGGETIKLFEETYMGVKLTGPVALIDRIEARMTALEDACATEE